LIAEIRGQRSLRKISEPSGIPASQLQYIERGTMAPTADVYPKLLDVLQPDKKQREEMDQLYMTIRKTPPPDVSGIICNNIGLNGILRGLGGQRLTDAQLSQVEKLLASFKEI
jgi:hypothetical protein